MDLGGKLHLFEMDLEKLFISQAIKSLQKALNLDLTMQARNSYTAGMRERHFLNADAPDELSIGAGAASYTQGVAVYDKDTGKVTGTANPSLVVIEPVQPDNFIKSEDATYAKILSQAEQRHVLISDSATASGKSRVEARAEFRTSLLNIKAPVDSSIRYVIEFAMAFAAALTGRTNEFEQFRVDANCIISAGVPSAEEKQSNRESYDKGEISLDTLRSLNGVEDTDAESVKIKSEDGFELNYLIEACEKAGVQVPLKMIIELLPFDEAKRTELLAFITEKLPKEEGTIQLVNWTE